jgi:hypothetical protein
VDDKTYLLASGEIGKNPAIYVYKWTNDLQKGGGFFTSLTCLKGFHVKG